MKKVLLVTLILIATISTVFAGARFDTPYIGNSFRKTFHYRNCESVNQMWEEHQVPLKTRDEAIKNGYRPCGNCRP